MSQIKYTITVYPKICMCGSTRFKEEFLYWARWLTLQGCIVTMPMVFGHAGDVISEEQKEALDKLHKIKIEEADAIFVVNVDGYIGESTRSEIAYAQKLGKYIIYL